MYVNPKAITAIVFLTTFVTAGAAAETGTVQIGGVTINLDTGPEP